MDDSPLLEYNYAKQVTAQNNMNIEVNNTPSNFGSLIYDFAMSSLQTLYVPHERASNSSPTDNINMSLEPSPPMVIPYSTNVPADLS